MFDIPLRKSVFKGNLSNQLDVFIQSLSNFLIFSRQLLLSQLSLLFDDQLTAFLEFQLILDLPVLIFQV
jgi:hypothetical protein